MPILTTLFLCGDVMCGRGIDQILPHPGDPVLYERAVRNAVRYVELAEAHSGAIERPVPFAYPWGDGLEILERMKPDLRLVNLETAVTTSGTPWPGKGIQYRMNPANLPFLAAAHIDGCTLANNHVLDWGTAGLAETTAALHGAGVKTAGAGADLAEATAPAVFAGPGETRILVFAFGSTTSGVPPAWAATAARPGVALLPEEPDEAVAAVRDAMKPHVRAGDVVIVAVHWGGNWGWTIPGAETTIAHRLVDELGVDAVVGSSSHHVKGLEVYGGRLILYGCGDLINDYEGIGGQESYRPDLALMYFPTIDASTGALVSLRLAPVRMHRLRLERAAADDTAWLRRTLDRESRRFGVRIEDGEDGLLVARWGAGEK